MKTPLDRAEERVLASLDLLDDGALTADQRERLRSGLRDTINAAEWRGAEGERQDRADQRREDNDIARAVRR